MSHGASTSANASKRLKILNYIKKQNVNVLDTSKSKEWDQFFTPSSLAVSLVKKTESILVARGYDFSSLTLFEPCGKGAFFDAFPQSNQKIAMEIDEVLARKHFKLGDFLKTSPKELKLHQKKTTVIITNPPFSKALKFFNHSCVFADVICMIVPVSFRSPSTVCKLNSSYHLLADINLNGISFSHKLSMVDIRCCFQIWEKKRNRRPFHPSLLFKIDDWKFDRKHPILWLINRTSLRYVGTVMLKQPIQKGSFQFV